MIEGGWSYVAGAYALAIGALAVLALLVFVRSLHWERRARELQQSKEKRTQ